MPENARTPSKTSQVAPAISATHTPRRIDEPIVESKKNLKPSALVSDAKFPTLEILADEKGIELDQPLSEEADRDSNDAWQGKLPEAVKQEGEFTEADVIFIDETAEREAQLAAEREAEREAMAEELENKIIAINTAVERKAMDKKQAEKKQEDEAAKKQKSMAVDQKLEAKPQNETSRQSEGEQKSAKKPATLAPSALTSKAKFPTLEGLAEEKGIEIEPISEQKNADDNNAAWQGKLPKAVKQEGEFTEADVIFIDETAEHEAKLAAEREAEREAMAEELESKIIAFNTAADKSKAKEQKEAERVAAKPSNPKQMESGAKAQPEPKAKVADVPAPSKDIRQPEAQQNTKQAPLAPKAQAIDAQPKQVLKAMEPDRAKKADPIIQTSSNKSAFSKPAAQPTQPSTESKINLKPAALASKEKLPVLKDEELIQAPQPKKAALAESKPQSLQSEEKARKQPLAWKGELPEAVRQDGEVAKSEVHFAEEPAQKKEQNKGMFMFRWFKGEPRETGLEKFFVRSASSILGFGLSIACGFLRLFGLRDLSGRLIMGCRNFVDNIIEGTFLRHFRSFGHQWWMYRLVVRIVQNIDRNVRARIGPEPGKDVEDKVNQVHREANSSLETAKKEYNRLRSEANEVIGEARERIRQGAVEAKKQ